MKNLALKFNIFSPTCLSLEENKNKKTSIHAEGKKRNLSLFFTHTHTLPNVFDNGGEKEMDQQELDAKDDRPDQDWSQRHRRGSIQVSKAKENAEVGSKHN